MKKGTDVLWVMVMDKKARSGNYSTGELWEVTQTLYMMVLKAVMMEQPWIQL